MRHIEMHPLRLFASALIAGRRLADSLVRCAMLVMGPGALLMFVMCTQSIAGTIAFPANGSGRLDDLSFGHGFDVSRDTPVGTVLYMAESPKVGVNASGVTCNVQKVVTVNGTAVPGNPSTFQTNVRGIGVRFYISDGWHGNWVQAPVTQTLPPMADGAYAHYTRADLVVTGPVSQGRLARGALPSMTVTFSGGCVTTTSTTQNLDYGTDITGSTCEVRTPSIDVSLPDAFASALSANGATTGATSFALGIYCFPYVKAYVTVTDASNPSNRSTTLSLAEGSSASGVGLQILNGTNLIAYGPDSAVAGNTNQWFVGTADDDGMQMQIPLSARYVRTTGPLVPGSVKGVATFTMSYQ